MRKLAVVTSSALASVSAAAAQQSRLFGEGNIRRYLQSQKRDYARGAAGSIAKANRNTGQPHEHKREIARRLARQERALA